MIHAIHVINAQHRHHYDASDTANYPVKTDAGQYDQRLSLNVCVPVATYVLPAQYDCMLYARALAVWRLNDVIISGGTINESCFAQPDEMGDDHYCNHNDCFDDDFLQHNITLRFRSFFQDTLLRIPAFLPAKLVSRNAEMLLGENINAIQVFMYLAIFSKTTLIIISHLAQIVKMLIALHQKTGILRPF